MAVTDLSETPGYVENPVTSPSTVEVPEPTATESILNIGDVPPPASSIEAPPVQSVVPGEALETPEVKTTPSDFSMSAEIQNAADSISALAASQKEQEEFAPSEEEAPKYNSVLSGIAPQQYASLVPVPKATQSPSFNNPRGYSSTLQTLATGPVETPISERSAPDSVNASSTSGNPLDVAKAYLGYDERNPQQAKALSEFFKKAGGTTLDPSTTAWCAAWANAVLGVSGYGGTGKVNARSFLDYGEPVDKPQVGDIVVFSRGDPNGWQGHVGFIAGVNKDGTLQVLGGNQSTSESQGRGVTVNIKTFTTDRVLGYRRPVPMEVANG